MHVHITQLALWYWSCSTRHKVGRSGRWEGTCSHPAAGMVTGVFFIRPQTGKEVCGAARQSGEAVGLCRGLMGELGAAVQVRRQMTEDAQVTSVPI